jgi:hypothetical protein
VLTSNPRTVAPKIYNMSECKMVYKTTIAKFFILSDNKTGVVVLTSVDPPDSYFVNEMFEIQNGFNSLEKEGVKKVSTISLNHLTIHFLNFLLNNFLPQ